MIIDSIGNIQNYKGITDNLDIAIEFISKGISSMMETGVLEIMGRDVYSVCAEYNTKNITECKNEAHRKYIDIQIILSGREMIYASDIEKLKIKEEYDAARDVLFLEDSREVCIEMIEGMFCIFFPWDAHMPGVSIDDRSSLVKKVVFKVNV